jgi:DNA-binding NarL/FixJ family response regulator
MNDSQRKFRVLIIDDSTIARMSIKKLLSERDYEIIEGVNGLEAIEKVNSLEPDLILMDYLMPQMNGLIALKIIRGKGITTPVIIISANQQEATISKFNEMSISGIIKKHPDKSELLRIIDLTFNTEKDK